MSGGIFGVDEADGAELRRIRRFSVCGRGRFSIWLISGLCIPGSGMLGQHCWHMRHIRRFSVAGQGRYSILLSGGFCFSVIGTLEQRR
jgi:hypothetical protein